VRRKLLLPLLSPLPPPPLLPLLLPSLAQRPDKNAQGKCWR